jgi:hypothetical protein
VPPAHPCEPPVTGVCRWMIYRYCTVVVREILSLITKSMLKIWISKITPFKYLRVCTVLSTVLLVLNIGRTDGTEPRPSVPSSPAEDRMSADIGRLLLIHIM